MNKLISSANKYNKLFLVNIKIKVFLYASNPMELQLFGASVWQRCAPQQKPHLCGITFQKCF